jgi:3-dehydroquinate dehydratase-2
MATTKKAPGKQRVLVMSGPNLNLLGTREPDKYGHDTLATIHKALKELGAELGVAVDCRQSNHEGELLDWIHETRGKHAGIVLNGGALTHTSIALRDARIACGRGRPSRLTRCFRRRGASAVCVAICWPSA